MSKILPPFFTALFLVAGCASDDYEPWVTRGVNAGIPEVRDSFTLERTACFGFCPVYKVIVDDRDILEFQGKRFVKEEGGAVGKRLPAGSYDKLRAIAAAHEFDDFDAAYPNDDASNCPQRATDAPTVIVGFEKKEKTRSVRVYEGCIGFEGRDRFDAMVAAMDAILDIDDLVGPREDFYGAKE